MMPVRPWRFLAMIISAFPFKDSKSASAAASFSTLFLVLKLLETTLLSRACEYNTFKALVRLPRTGVFSFVEIIFLPVVLHDFQSKPLFLQISIPRHERQDAQAREICSF